MVGVMPLWAPGMLLRGSAERVLILTGDGQRLGPYLPDLTAWSVLRRGNWLRR